METSESLKEGLVPGPPFLVRRPVITNIEISNVSGLQESDSSATPAVIFSTLVAVCGSFAYGCAVSLIVVLLLSEQINTFYLQD